jgi:hypothetical protein
VKTPRTLAYSGLLLAATLVIVGCGGNNSTNSANPRSARLCEDEMYRMGEQMKSVQKQLEEQKAIAEAATKEKADFEKGCNDSVNFFMDQFKEKDTEIARLNARIAELEKAQPQTPAK